MLCPTCHSAACRRSRRRGLKDNLLSLTGVRPWRCRTCDVRFYAWLVSARLAFYAHCPLCGNFDLHHVSHDHVAAGWTRSLYRLLRFHAYRCDACRYRFFTAKKFRRIVPTNTGKPAATDAEQPAEAHASEAPATTHHSES